MIQGTTAFDSSIKVGDAYTFTIDIDPVGLIASDYGDSALAFYDNTQVGSSSVEVGDYTISPSELYSVGVSVNARPYYGYQFALYPGANNGFSFGYVFLTLRGTNPLVAPTDSLSSIQAFPLSYFDQLQMTFEIAEAPADPTPTSQDFSLIDGNITGYTFTLIPEPSTWALLLFGFGSTVAFRFLAAAQPSALRRR